MALGLFARITGAVLLIAVAIPTAGILFTALETDSIAVETPPRQPRPAPEPDDANGIAVTLGEAISGQLVEARAAGASPGEHVWFLFGTKNGLDACSGNFGAACETIAGYEIADRVEADADGRATASWRVPRDYQGPVYAQAGVVRGHAGDESVLSSTVHTDAGR
jgi:hypothetical protein